MQGKVFPPTRHQAVDLGGKIVVAQLVAGVDHDDLPGARLGARGGLGQPRGRWDHGMPVVERTQVRSSARVDRGRQDHPGSDQRDPATARRITR